MVAGPDALPALNRFSTFHVMTLNTLRLLPPNRTRDCTTEAAPALIHDYGKSAACQLGEARQIVEWAPTISSRELHADAGLAECVLEHAKPLVPCRKTEGR